MTMSLLKSKLTIPAPRRELVLRPRLVERLTAGLDCKLTLISAPAGFGKTTLLSEWAGCAGAATAPLPVAWLSLDERDNNPTRFWTYVVAALQTLHDGVGTSVLEALHSPQGRPSEALLGDLTDQISELPEHLALVLDDLHLITNAQIHEQLTFFVEHSPAQMHLLVCSRADPPWPLARWRARGQVFELRADDLRFTVAEAAAFLGDTMGLDLSPEDIAVLSTRTEGWIAGLQLAALAMQKTPSAQGGDVGSFVRALSGSQRFILDYLVEEVLDRQPADIQQFLLQTSILERLTASLCDAVRFGVAEPPNSSPGTAVRFGVAEPPSSAHDSVARCDESGSPHTLEREDSQTILERLERANLFLVPLDDERRWYRYHRLFADLLRSRLEQDNRERVAALHRRASAWCEWQGLISEAVSHALAARDVARVARIARERVLATMDPGELTALAGMLGELPDDQLSSRPWLCLAHAWALAFAGHLDAAELRLKNAEATMELLGDARPAEAGRIAGHIAAIRAYVAAVRGDMSRAAELTREALHQLPEEDLAARGFYAGLLGSALRWSGNLTMAAQGLDSAIASTHAAGAGQAAMEVLFSLAAVQLAQGQLHRTVASCRDALLLADETVARGGRRPVVAASGHNLISHVLREWNDLDGALRHAREGIALCERWGWPEGLALGYWRLARALQAIRDKLGASEAMQNAGQAASDLSPWFGGLMAAHHARIWLAQGRLAPASHWARESGLRVDDELSFRDLDGYAVLARVLVAEGKAPEALRLLARIAEKTEAAGAMGYQIEALVLQAVALQTQAAGDQAMAPLERALTLAEPEGFVRVFVDEGASMDRLLRHAVTQGLAAAYAGKLLAALDRDAVKGAPPEAELLSPRETEVLRLLTTHLSHSEIAEELVVSVNTVRSHIKSIYSKLDVHSRMGAVERGRELGLLA